MARTVVKCKYCGEKFVKETTPARKEGNRWVHESCFDFTQSIEGQRERLRAYINQKLKKSANWTKINQQIKEYETSGFTLDGMLLTLKYWFDIKKHPVKKSQGGIGIVKYIYNEAGEYYARNKTLEALASNVRSGKVLKPNKTSDIVVIKKKMKSKQDKLLPLEYEDDL